MGLTHTISLTYKVLPIWIHTTISLTHMVLLTSAFLIIPFPPLFHSFRYGQFTYRVGVWLVLTHAVSCRIALSNMYCVDALSLTDAQYMYGGEGNTLIDGGDDTSCLTTARNPAWWILFLVHGVGFPLSICLGAIFVRRRLLGGTCCSDTETTTENQLSDTRATGELGLWRYYIGTLGS